MTFSEDPDEMPLNAAFHHGMHCLLILKKIPRDRIYHNLEKSTCDPFKYTMSSPLLILFICMGKSSDYK